MRELELYVHIPFCVQKCAYCDFLSAPADEAVRQEYVDALIQEIRGYKNIYGKYQAGTVFVGGGTPSILSPAQAGEIFSALLENFRIAEGAEITIESNPGTVTEEKLLAWKKAGVNRISIGLQSAKDEELRMLGRIHDYRQFLDTWKLIRRTGMHNVNIDLISAIPGQTLESWKETLQKTAELQPEHLSVYSLMIEEGTLFYERYGEPAEQKQQNGHPFPTLPEEETERRIYQETENILQKYGYSRYEISNYAKKGHACRHNIGYWKRTEYLGIGLGASSLIGSTRFRHISDLREYMDRVKNRQNLCEEEERLSVKDEMEEFLFLGLRMMCGVQKSEFARLFGVQMEDVYGEQMERLEKSGLLKIEGDIVRLTKRGIDISNYVFGEFLLQEPPWPAA